MLKIDLHIHTVHSGHAYGSIYDILEEAGRKKMDMIAITDHGPNLIGSAPASHFVMGARAPKEYKGVKVLWGCEANIINENGDIDITEEIIKKLDVILAQIHISTSYKDLGREKNTNAIINCFKKYPIHIFSHPDVMACDYDFEKVCESACENNVLLELNISSFGKIKEGKSNLKRIKKIIEISRKHEKKIIINSDAHFLPEVGNDDILKKYWDGLNLSDDIIINNFPDELMAFLENKK